MTSEPAKCTHESFMELAKGYIETIDCARCPDCDALYMDGKWQEADERHERSER